MPVYEITTFRGGLSDYEDKGISGAFKFGSNLDIRKRIDSLSCKQALVDEGLDSSASPSLSVSPSASESRSKSPSPSATPSATPSPSASVSPSVSASATPSTTVSSSDSPSPSPSAGLTTVFNDLIRVFVKSNDGYTYGFGNTGYVYRRDADAYWDIVYKDSDGGIAGAAEWYSATETYLYFVADGKLKRKELPGLDNWNDVEVVDPNLNTSDWHTMTEAGGALMIANGPWLAMVGYDQSYTNEALNLIPGNVAKTVIERNGRTIIGTSRLSDPNKSINGAIDTEIPLAQVGDDGELYYANMIDSVPIKEFAGGGKCNPGGVANEIEQVNFFEWEQTALSWIDKQSVGNMALFAMYDADAGKGGIYSYGRKNKNHPMVMNLDYLLDADELGALASVDGTILVSYQDGSDFGVKGTDADAKATGTYEGIDFKAPVKKPANITNWKYAEIFCASLPAATTIEFWYKKNKSGSFIQATAGDGDTSLNTTGEQTVVFNIGVEAEIFEPRVVLNPSGNNSPEVYKIKVYFD